MRHDDARDPRSARNHRGVRRQLREHGAAYDALVRAFRGQPCALRLDARCTGIATGADLIVPRSQGGRAVRENARPACAHCQNVQGGRLAGAR
jgi:5-methylcytosine-specific restriction endonuclease McrA